MSRSRQTVYSIFKTVAIFYRFKQYNPLTNSVEIFNRKPVDEVLLKSIQTYDVIVVPYSDTMNMFSLFLSKTIVVAYNQDYCLWKHVTQDL